MKKMRKVFVVTERRADYSRFKPILTLIKEDPCLEYYLAVTGCHLKPEHGNTIHEIKKDGFKISSELQMFTEKGDSGASMVRAFGRIIQQLTYELEKSQPDLILAGFDIAANFAVAIAGAHMNIPVAHIPGGEVSGTIDESIRHAMTKFSHYHFAANSDACQRLIKMGERPAHVFNVGCPSIDAIKQVSRIPKKELLSQYHLKPSYALVLQHPVTSELTRSSFQIRQTLEAVTKAGLSSLVIYPNNDAGCSSIIKYITGSSINHVPSLSLEHYVNLLRNCAMLIGNSSSGIHESSTFGIPTINIGSRQAGRLRSSNIIDVGYDKNEIHEAIITCKESSAFQRRCAEAPNPYGDGKSSQKIINLLKTLSLDEGVIQKQITY
jgi:UDP-N-acetylglucosamine 2-epimerase (non-hydrolysing)/GDP/UDP-N,N'-diacetylbacillosamine 2-epimerase (hydrolysing)